MSAFTLKFFTSYLLMPLIAIIMVFVVMLIAKKNNLLKNKKLIFFILLSGVVLGSPGLAGFSGYNFMPFLYILLQLLYVVLGVVNIRILHKMLPELEEKPYILEILLILVQLIVGAVIFTLLFNLTNEMDYGLIACTCLITFVIPSLFAKAYQSFIDIPAEIYDVWSYDANLSFSDFENLDYSKLMVLELELLKNPDDTSPLKVKVKAPDSIEFGVWFQKFIDDYNLKYPAASIDYSDCGWIFYYKPSIFRMRKYIDFRQTIAQNKISEKYTLIAKRVVETEIEF